MQNKKPDDFINVTFTFEQRGKLVALIDNYGAICGFFASENDARRHIPAIRRKVVRFLKRRETDKRKKDRQTNNVKT